MYYFDFQPQTLDIAKKAERDIAPLFSHIKDVSSYNTQKVMAAFAKNRVSEACFAPSTGYGYDDKGRDTLDRVFADAFGAEDALVRPHFINGTHAIATALYALLKPGDTLLSAAGKPYDTLENVIGIGAAPSGSLAEIGVKYRQLDLPEHPDDCDYLGQLRDICRDAQPRAVLIQRSRGYASRITLTPGDIRIMSAVIKDACDAHVIVDNCYGEFTDYDEPVAGQTEALIPPHAGGFATHFSCPLISPAPADLIIGSLIKNPGGGLAPTGGYIAGRSTLVNKCAERLTVPGIGREAGCNASGWRLYYQGFFFAPHVTAEALKTAVFCARALELAGYSASPKSTENRFDIIQSVTFGKPEPLLAFCRGIQAGAPVDSYVTPEPWAMPGYTSPVVMAAGAFNQGASVELSADAPMREPYTLFIQGGLTFESGRLGIMTALENIL